MSLGNILGIISIIMGIPGLWVSIGIETHREWGILAVAVAIILAILWWILNQPSWTIIEMMKELEIETQGSSLTTATITTKMRANHKGLTEFTHRNIRADGTINNFKLDSVKVVGTDKERRSQEHIVHERFKAMDFWKTRVSRLTYDLFNSFPNSTESTSYIPDYFTNKYIVEVHLPPSRPARNQKAYVGLGAEMKNLSTPHLSNNGLVIRWESERLKPGKYYTVEWDW